MSQDDLKQSVAREAIKHVVDDAVVGVGSGSTANFFIDELAKIKGRIAGAVAPSTKEYLYFLRVGATSFKQPSCSMIGNT